MHSDYNEEIYMEYVVPKNYLFKNKLSKIVRTIERSFEATIGK